MLGLCLPLSLALRLVLLLISAIHCAPPLAFSGILIVRNTSY